MKNKQHPVKLINSGKEIFISTSESRNAIKQRIADSFRNCIMICFLLPPAIFLTPISFALFIESAILILIKLIYLFSSQDQFPQFGYVLTDALAFALPVFVFS